MREAMTEELRHVLEAAQTQARELNQEFVGTEHLLLGLLNSDSGDSSPSEAARAIRRSEISPEELHRAVIEALPRGSEPPVVTGSLPLSPKARRAINAALALAQAHHEPSVSTRWLLSALLEEPESEIRAAFRSCGVDVEQLQRLLDHAPTPREK